MDNKKRVNLFVTLGVFVIVVLLMYFVLAATPVAQVTNVNITNNATAYYDEGNFTINWSFTSAGVGIFVIWPFALNSSGNIPVVFANDSNNTAKGFSFNNWTEGNYTFRIAGYNSTGFGTNSTNVSMTVDRTGPNITLHHPSNNSATAGSNKTYLQANGTLRKNTQQMTLNISIVDASSGVTGSHCLVDVNGSNQTIPVSGGWCNSSYVNLTGQADGNRTIRIYANDTLNFSTLYNNYVVQVDTTAPVINLSTYTNATAKNANTTTLTLNISVADATSRLTESMCILNINGTNQTIDVSNGWCNTTSGKLLGLGEGNQTITVWANDTINNLGINQSHDVFIDTINPTATAACTPSNPTDNGEIVTCTCSGSDAGSGVLSSTVNRVDTTSTAGTFSYSCSASDNAGNSGSATATYIVTGGSSTSSSSSGGGGGSVSTTKSNIFTKVTPGKVSIMKNFNKDTGVKEIQIEVNNEVKNIKVTVSKYDGKPAAVSKEKTGKVFQYMEIKVDNVGSDLKKATVTTKVEKSWVTDNSLEKENLALFKFNEETEAWDELVTTFKEEDDTYYYFDSELTSFSFFAISEKVVVEEESSGIGTILSDAFPDEVTETIKKNSKWLWIVIVIVVIAIAYAVIARRKK